jgi:hypothetical protein
MSNIIKYKDFIDQINFTKFKKIINEHSMLITCTNNEAKLWSPFRIEAVKIIEKKNGWERVKYI